MNEFENVARPLASPDYQSPQENTNAISDARIVADAGVGNDGETGAEATLASVMIGDSLTYTLTVEQARERILSERRRVPSSRTMQRFCIEGRLKARKIKTSFGSEWLINEQSLSALIDREPVELVASATNVVTTPASATPVAAPAFAPQPQTVTPVAKHFSDASIGDTVASDGVGDVGERRTISDILIENARLLAKVEEKDERIHELRSERDWLREDVRESRLMRGDIKSMADKMLDTLKSFARPQLAAPARDPSTTTTMDGIRFRQANQEEGREVGAVE
jgi:hypothetical protein